MLPPFQWLEQRRIIGVNALRSSLLCFLAILVRPVHPVPTRPDWPFHWGFAERFAPVDYSNKKVLLLGADTVMGQDAAVALRRDCAHLFLIAATAEGAQAT